jgi:hypothetical protein
MSKILFSGVVTTAAQLTEPFLQHFKVIEDTYGALLMDTELWHQIVLSKSSPGVYSMLHSINVPVHFPHSLTRTPIDCIPLSPSHLRPSQTTDATRPAWHSAKVSIHIDPPDAWDLPTDICTLQNPTCLCHVTLRVFDLLFLQFIDTDAERHKFEKTMTVANVQIERSADLKTLVTIPGFKMRYMHTTKRCPEIQIWHDLITAATHQKNTFTIPLPHLIRMMPESTTTGDRGVPAGISVLEVDGDTLARLGYKSKTQQQQEGEANSAIGLFSAHLNLLLMHPTTHISPVTYCIWPDIPPKLEDLLLVKSPPRCRIGLYLSDVRFVAMADDKELRAMASGRRAWKIW